MSSSDSDYEMGEELRPDDTTLKLSCGNSVSFIHQVSKGISNFSTRYVPSDDSTNFGRMFGKLPFDTDVFTTFHLRTSIDGDFFIPRTYGQWWDKIPSGPNEDFMPQNNDLIVGHDFVDFIFKKEVYPIRLCIFEAYYPGCIIRIWANDCDSKLWQELWSSPVENCSSKSRMFLPSLKTCRFKTKMLRLELSHSHLEYFTQLDGAFLMGTEEFILPRDKSENSRLRTLCLNLGDSESNAKNAQSVITSSTCKDALDNNLLELKKVLSKHWILCKESINVDEVPRGKSLSASSLDESPVESFSTNDTRDILDALPRGKSLSANSLDESLGEIFSTSDIFDALPDEKLLQILKLLDLRSLCRCSQVNRRFNYLTRDALLYTSLNLKPYWNLVDARVLSYLTSRSKYLRRLDLSWCGSYETSAIRPSDFKNFLNVCGGQLTNLRLNCCLFVDDSVIQEIASSCKSLKELRLNNCRKITSGGLKHLEKLQSLERLELNYTKIETSALCSILKRNTKMRHLNLAETSRALNIDTVAIELANSCPRLESLDCWYSRTLSFVGLVTLSRCANLREIDFGFCPEMYNLNHRAEDSMRNFLSCCGSLEKVGLSAQPFLRDPDLQPLLSSQRLRQLHLGGPGNLTMEFFTRVLSSCPQLQMLDLSGYKNVSDADLETMRKLYPQVFIQRVMVNWG